MACAILVSVPPASSSHFSHQTHLFKAVKYSQLPPSVPSNLTLKNPSNLIPLCASSSIPLVDKEEASSAEEGGVSVQPQPPTMPSDNASLRGCKACGREEIEKNCNGDGRIQGGIATVPGFGWWPIKAFRPCPGFVASGGRYRRRGQTMDEVTSGEGRKKPSVRTVNEVKSKKKK